MEVPICVEPDCDTPVTRKHGRGRAPERCDEHRTQRRRDQRRQRTTAATLPAERCRWCAARMTGVLGAVRDDIDLLGDLAGIDPSLAQIAYQLAEQVDACEDPKVLPPLVRQLRSTLKDIVGTRITRADNDDELDGMGDPV